jgi:hypothetical protein
VHVPVGAAAAISINPCNGLQPDRDRLNHIAYFTSAAVSRRTVALRR